MSRADAVMENISYEVVAKRSGFEKAIAMAKAFCHCVPSSIDPLLPQMESACLVKIVRMDKLENKDFAEYGNHMKIMRPGI